VKAIKIKKKSKKTKNQKKGKRPHSIFNLSIMSKEKIDYKK
jgi:hypothetical protein